MRSKVVSPKEAVMCIQDGQTIAVDGFAPIGGPEELLIALKERFLESGHPRALTIISASYGNSRGRGLDHLAQDGLIQRMIGGYFNLNPSLGKMIMEGRIEGYLFPLGVVSQIYREIAAGRPGLVTHVGLGTFIDPRVEGNKLNAISKLDLIEVIELGGREWLFYKAFPINAGLIRGTTADEFGNITMEREAAYYNGLSIAQAVHNCGGKVIAQVERLAAAGSLNPKMVKIPGILVDFVVVARPENHLQTFREPYNPYYSGEVKAPASAVRPIPLDARKVIGRRAAMELHEGAVVNLGVGMPEFVAQIAAEEGIFDRFTLTVEDGPIGGVPSYGLSFGATVNPQAILDMPYQFDFYDGGGLDLTFVGFAQIDQHGNVNVSKLATRLPGVGGFLNVTQKAKKVVFCGTFTASDPPEVAVESGRVLIGREGRVKKFVPSVDQVTFSAAYARRQRQKVLYVTERAIFELGPDGIVLSEVAPGVDIERQILSQMEFRPRIKADLKPMSPRIFAEGLMGLKHAYA